MQREQMGTLQGWAASFASDNHPPLVVGATNDEWECARQSRAPRSHIRRKCWLRSIEGVCLITLS